MTPFVERMIRAAKLDVQLYEEVEADRSAMGQAMGVVVLSSLAGGVGFMQGVDPTGLLIGTGGSLVAWFIWSFMTYVIGTKLLPEPQTHVTYGQLLRTVGFSSAPGIIRFLGIIPGLGTIVNLLAGGWMLVTMIIAVRQALDYRSTYRAIGVCLIGWVILGILLAIILKMGETPPPPVAF